MYFGRRFLYIPCFITFSQAELDLGNNEINAVSKTLAFGSEENTRGVGGRAESPVPGVPLSKQMPPGCPVLLSES